MANRELDLLAHRFVKKRCDTFPHVGTHYGFTEYYPLLAYPSKEQVESFVGFLENLLQETEAILDELDGIAKIDQQSLEFMAPVLSWWGTFVFGPDISIITYRQPFLFGSGRVYPMGWMRSRASCGPGGYDAIFNTIQR